MEQEPLGKLIHQISTNIQKEANHRLKALGLSMTQGLGLIWLEEAPDHSLPIKTLETMFETSQPTTLGVVCRLEQKNLVSSSLSPKRTKVVTITEEGIAMVGAVKDCIQEVEQQFYQGFAPEEKAILVALLHRGKENLKSEVDQKKETSQVDQNKETNQLEQKKESVTT